MYPRAIAKRKICKIGRACGLGCVPKTHNCKVALRGQAKTAVEWLAHVTANPNYEEENNAKIDARLKRFNNRVKTYYQYSLKKDVQKAIEDRKNNPDSVTAENSDYTIYLWEDGRQSKISYNQLVSKLGEEKANEYLKKLFTTTLETAQNTKRYYNKEHLASKHPYNQQSTPEDEAIQREAKKQQHVKEQQQIEKQRRQEKEYRREQARRQIEEWRRENEERLRQIEEQRQIEKQRRKQRQAEERRMLDEVYGNINYVSPDRVRKARKKLSTGTATPEDAKQIRTMSHLARSLAQKETTEGGKRLLSDVSHIWSYIASGMRLKNTIVVRSRDGVESAARITSQKNYIYVDYLASNPRNVAGGKGAISGSATAALVAVAKKAYAEGKGFHLTALSSAVPFYRKIGMTEVEPHHFKVKKDDVLEFINKNTPRKNNVKTN